MKTSPSILLIVLVLSAFALKSSAQQNKESIKAQRKELNDKALKSAREEAKNLELDGWFTQLGAIPLEKQIERARMKEVEVGDDGFSKYYTATGNSSGKTQSIAKNQAYEIAKSNLCKIIYSDTFNDIHTHMIELAVSYDDTVTITSAINTSFEVTPRKLTKVIVLMEIYKKQEASFECIIKIAYSIELAKKTIKETIKESLQQSSTLTVDKLDELIDF